jgi:predicted ATPase
MLKHMKVKGYKSIKDMELELRPLTVFIGANGPEKSNLISLFYLIDRIIENRLQLYVSQAGGADSLLYFGQKITDEVSVQLDFEENGYGFTLVPTRENTLTFSDEKYFEKTGVKETKIAHLGSGQKESRLLDETRKKTGAAAARKTGGQVFCAYTYAISVNVGRGQGGHRGKCIKYLATCFLGEVQALRREL